MHTIHKYPLDHCQHQRISIPAMARIFSVKVQKGDLAIYARVNTENSTRNRNIFCYGTGEEIPHHLGLQFIDTCLLEGGEHVIHVFDGGES